MYSGLGAAAGFVGFIALSQTVLETMYLDKDQIMIGASVLAAIGGAIGRLIANRQYL
jgi:hypothetical protein